MAKGNGREMSKLAKFSGIGIQMGIIIGGFAWLGSYLDERYETKDPWWTICLCLFGVFAGLYLMIKEVMNLDKDDDAK